MKMTVEKLSKKKRHKLLILVASNIHAGIQCLYIEAQESGWTIIGNQLVPYPQKICDLISQCSQQENPSLNLNDFAQLDYLMTMHYNHCASNLLNTIPKTKQPPDCIVVKKHILWKGTLQDKQADEQWSLDCGDLQVLANNLHAPVLTDFFRQGILEKATAPFSVLYGTMKIAEKIAEESVVFLDLGLVSRLTILDTVGKQVVVDEAVGPCTALLDHAAKEAGKDCGFDRDGTSTLSGKVNTDTLVALITDVSNSVEADFYSDKNHLNEILGHKALKGLSSEDTLATVTAFTAQIANNLFKKIWTSTKKPKSLWLSGGGTNNIALVNFITAYFEPIPVKKIESLDIPHNDRMPLSLGLTVQAYLNKKRLSIKGEKAKTYKHLGRWILPQ